MNKTVALEGGLSNIRQALEGKGYRVIDLDTGNLEQASAVIISGGDRNFMNRQDISTRAPVINAEGQSADEVIQTLENRLRLVE